MMHSSLADMNNSKRITTVALKQKVYEQRVWVGEKLS